MYRLAQEALSRFRVSGASSDDLAAIAQVLLAVKDMEMEGSQFPYVGNPLDPRDRAIVEAYEQEWQAFLLGDDDETYG